jgi:hypothetical protein
VEHPCHRCGATVEDGTPFCKQCGAPQIRVAVESSSPSGSTPQTIPNDAETANGSPPARPELSGVVAPIQWTHALPAAIWAGVLEAVFALLVPVIGTLVGGFVCVAIYRRRLFSGPVGPRVGARLGLTSGAIGFGVFAIIASAGVLFFHTGADLRDVMMKALEQSASRYPAAQAESLLQFMKSQQGWALFVAIVTIINLLAFVLLSTLGGLIGGAVLGRKSR